MHYAVGDNFYNVKNIERMGSHYDYEKEMISFYKGAPCRGYYINYLKKLAKDTLSFLKNPVFRNLIGKTVVMDVDDTLVWTRPYNPLVRKKERIAKYGNVVHYDALPPMVSMARNIQKLGYHLIIVTARGPHMFWDTVTNLNAFGLYPDKVFTSLYYGQDQNFKSVMRNNMEKTDLLTLQRMSNEDIFSGNFSCSSSPLNLKVIMTIGDRWQDVLGQKNTLGLKLPDPLDMNGYFVYNDVKRLL